MKRYISLVIKGMAMGAANVVPGVSGGTVALITGIFEKLIDSIKSFDLTALQLLLTGKWRSFAKHINLDFLLAVFAGVIFSILTLAKLFDFLFESFPIYIWSYFFGLILASVFFVAKRVDKWNWATLLSLVLGAVVAATISFLNPASENSSVIYLLVCGLVAACSMILPGLSGSFVLILMGNYQLVMIDSVNNLNVLILLPVVIGAVVGLMAFSHILSWVFKRYKDQTIALLSGFIVGSLGILWPWKNPVFKLDSLGNVLLKKSGEKVIAGYDWIFPDALNAEVLVAIGLMFAGVLTIFLMEKIAESAES